MGLPKEERRNALVGLGSSLRNIGEGERSIALLRSALDEFPADAAIAAFLALSLYSAGQSKQAVQLLMDVVIRHAPVGQYARALTQYRELLDSP